MANFIKMKRDKNDYPMPPHTADVHVNQVGEMQQSGWVKVVVKKKAPTARQKKLAIKRAAAKKARAENQADV